MHTDVIYGDEDSRVWIVILGVLTVLIVATTAVAWNQYGPGLLTHSFQTILADPFVVYAIVDFMVMLGVVSWWMARDARRRGIGVWYWIVSFYLLGTIGLMGYLLVARRHAPIVRA